MNAYERITDRIIALLEQDTAPWHKPWNARTSMPRNLVTRKPYRGINVFLLLAMNYESPFWLTFRQAVQRAGTVKKGEKSCPVVFWKPMTIEDQKSGEERVVPLLRYYHVFNVAQCDGIGDTTSTATSVPELEIVCAKPDAIVAGMPNPPAIKHGFACASYSPSEDEVGMPSRDGFDTNEAYYSTLFHELIHSTGHENRLNRPLTYISGYGRDPYCKEELIAEMGAAFLCAHAEIVEDTIRNSAAYIDGWLKQLRKDKTLVVQAAAQAQKAADFILGSDTTQSTVVDETKSVPSDALCTTAT